LFIFNYTLHDYPLRSLKEAKYIGLTIIQDLTLKKATFITSALQTKVKRTAQLKARGEGSPHDEHRFSGERPVKL
jgi:hypothetical protein